MAFCHIPIPLFLCLTTLPVSCILCELTMTNDLQKGLAAIRSRKAAKIRQRDQLNVEIAQLDATERGFLGALGEQMEAEIAWTDLVRTVIRQFGGTPVSALEVRDTLKSWGYSFTGMANPLAFFNNILQRLHAQHEVQRTGIGRPFRFW
jgi:hypothetical protein